MRKTGGYTRYRAYEKRRRWEENQEDAGKPENTEG